MTMFRSTLLVFTSLAVTTAAFAQAAPGTSAVTKDQIPALVKEALMNDPEMIMQALETLRKKKAEAEKKGAQAALEKYKSDIYDANTPSVGPADADVTIVEFFDYHCGYCKRLTPDLTKILAEDKKVRVLFKELPIFGENSDVASKAALAVHRVNKDKYLDFHTALMKESGNFDEKRLLDIAAKIGVNADKMKAEMMKPELMAMIEKNHEVAEALGIRGTPALIFGSEVIPGAMDYNELKQAIADQRSKKSPPAK